MSRTAIAASLLIALSLLPVRVTAQETSPAATLASSRFYAAGSFEHRSFFNGLQPWQLASVEVGDRLASGTLIVRGNHARRFGSAANQVEADGYPRLGARTYVYMNVGYGEEPLFPRWRSGAEIFTVLGNAWEGSLGLRQLRFTDTPLTLYTGSVGKYAGNWWLSLRPWVRSSTGAMSGSLSFSARRYGVDRDHFVGVQLGAGATPSDRLTSTELARTSSVMGMLSGSGGPWQRTVLTWSVGSEYERLSPTRTRTSLVLSAGVRHQL